MLSPHFPYIHLDKPTKGKLDGKTVYITDVSINGVQILHQIPITSDTPSIEFAWNGYDIGGRGTPLSTREIERRTSTGIQRLHSTLIELEEMTDDSGRHLRELVEYFLERALDERKSNARGVPARAANSYQTGAASSGYRQWSLMPDGSWKSVDTEDATQPAEGFTVSLDEVDEEVDRLREVYSDSDRDGRALIRRMAQLSVSEKGGVSTRRYNP